jgi:glycosyltransferase involved in cell wall biosynthesis/predicted metal-dependent phosphoesterase TrpH
VTDAPIVRCDLHLHSRYSTDSGNFALRRARLGESFTEPEVAYRAARARGMTHVTLSDHNTVEGALRIAHLPDTFLSVEVTTRFPENDLPLHVLVWNLTEEDHRDLQPYRASVYELVRFLRERRLAHALAHPLYRMGPPIGRSEVERMLLLFGAWEGRNGARPREANELGCRLAATASPDYLAKLAELHGIEPVHAGGVALTGGSDDHGGLDVATTWTEAPGRSVEEFLAAATGGLGAPHGEHGSTEKLAHATAKLLLGAYRADGGELPQPWGAFVGALFDDIPADPAERHRQIALAASFASRQLGERARAGRVGMGDLGGLPNRLGMVMGAAGLIAPYFVTAQHHAGSRNGLRELEETFFGPTGRGDTPRTLIFTDTFDEVNGVANTMRRLAAEGAIDGSVLVVASRADSCDEPGLVAFEPEWSVPLPSYESIELRVPPLLELLARVEHERPDVIQVATPGPMGLAGLLAGRILGVPVVGSYHTELGPYALLLTRDLLVSDLIGSYVDWFYRACDAVLAPTSTVARALRERGYRIPVDIWGRSVDPARFTPARRAHRRAELLGDGDLLLVSVGRVSPEKRLDVLLEAFATLRGQHPGARLVIAGEGPGRERLEAAAPAGVRFLGLIEGDELADLFAAGDVFCFPSTTDTFGQVLLEAAASGLPAVAARAGGAAELVQDDVTGVLVPPDDAPAFAAALGRLAADPALRGELGRAARAAAMERSWSRSMVELREAWHTQAGAQAGRPGVAVA